MSDRLNGKVQVLASALADVIQGAVDDSTAKVLGQVKEDNEKTIKAVRDAILNS
jgi:hypothetical protein